MLWYLLVLFAGLVIVVYVPGLTEFLPHALGFKT
jgi:TRAP-type C4-dicarboxylate transport system permease large subunit